MAVHYDWLEVREMDWNGKLYMEQNNHVRIRAGTKLNIEFSPASTYIKAPGDGIAMLSHKKTGRITGVAGGEIETLRRPLGKSEFHILGRREREWNRNAEMPRERAQAIE